VVAYLTWAGANTDQVNAMSARQNEVEPFGSINEISAVTGVFLSVVSDLQAQPHPTTSPLNFISLFSASALDDPIDLHVPDSSNAYIYECPRQIADLSQKTMRSACMTIYLLRQTVVVQIVQWMLNGGFIIMFISGIRNGVQKLASG
jgi:hypothetical protein